MMWLTIAITAAVLLLSSPFYGARGQEEADPPFIVASRSALMLVLAALIVWQAIQIWND
jgi:hypothetical protein